MKRFKEKVPSDAQARLIARVWSCNTTIPVLKKGWERDPTTNAVVREGWLEPQGIFGHYPSGQEWETYNVGAKGLRALHTYLIANGHAYGDRA